MPQRKRKQREHTEDWQIIKQYTLFSEQQAYELLRPIVLFGDPTMKRAGETGEAKSTLDRRAGAFDESGHGQSVCDKTIKKATGNCS